MAEIINVKTGKKFEVKDGQSITEASVNLGVPFSCEDGYCGMCRIDIIEGEENLSDLSESEDNMGLDRKQRLACQCRIKEGKVKISF